MDVYYRLVIWSVLILNVRVSLFIYARPYSQTQASWDRFTPTVFTCYCESGCGGCLLMCSRCSPVMEDIYRLVAQTQRCSFHRLHPAREGSSSRQQGKNDQKPEEHECHSPGALRTISIRYVENYERSCSCSCKPSAQPSSSSITASWPHGGAVCSYSERRRLCNVMTANRELPYYIIWVLEDFG